MMGPSRRSPTLFTLGEFTSHSGLTLPFKIDCDALTDADLACLADVIANRHAFSRAVGVPRGGLRLAVALQPYINPRLTSIMIVDDVLTTGKSMEDTRNELYAENGRRMAAGEKVSSLMGRAIFGLVIFARGPCPAWVTPLFRCEL